MKKLTLLASPERQKLVEALKKAGF